MSFKDVVPTKSESAAARRKAFVSEGVLIGKIEEFVSKGTHHEARAPGHHCSEIYKMCSREKILDLIFPDIKRVTTPDTQLQLIFDVGHALHGWFQNRYFGPAGILKGTWLCLKCDAKTPGLMPKRCPSCDADQWRLQYMEPAISEPTLKIVGHADGILDGPALATVLGEIFQLKPGETVPEDVLLEIKTINPNSFASIKGPLPAHYFQVNVYMHFLGLKKALVLYINKATSQLREFTVEYDPEVWTMVQRKLGSLLRFKKQCENHQSVKDMDWFEMWFTQVWGVCPNRDYKAAQTCPHAEVCFALKEGKSLATPLPFPKVYEVQPEGVDDDE